MKLRTLPIFSVMVVLGTLSLAGSQPRRPDKEIVTAPPNPSKGDFGRKKADAFEAGGFRAAAAVTGSFSVARSAHALNANTLEFLIEHSPLVVVGTILANRMWLNAPGDVITTDYEVAVEQSLKGPARPTGRMTMSVEGGKVRFEDGSWAELRISDMLLPLNGERYILFLKPTRFEPGPAQRSAAQGPIYAPSFYALSLYRVSDRGVITPKTFSRHPLFKAYAGKSERTLIDDIIAATDSQKSARR